MDAQLRKQLTDTIRYRRYKQRLGDGEIQYQEPIEMSGLVYGQVRIFRSDRGEESTSAQTLLLDGKAPIDLFGDHRLRAQFELAQGWRSPSSINPMFDERGYLDTIEVTF